MKRCRWTKRWVVGGRMLRYQATMHRRALGCLTVRSVACVLLMACTTHRAADGVPEADAGQGPDDEGIAADSGRESPAGELLPLGGRGGDSTADAGDRGGSDDGPAQDAAVAPAADVRDAGDVGDAGAAGDAGDASVGDATADAATPCVLDATRCESGARERCDGTGWIADACPFETPACEGGDCVLRGPSMVQVGAFYIDSTEVTVAQYRAFLEAAGDEVSGQPGVCAWNTEYYAADGPTGIETWPITSVDWCDARAYCSWAGKRLCGAIEGGAVAGADALDAGHSQWFLACGGPGSGSHPNTDPTCNSSGGNGLADVASYPDCEGFYPGLFDMEGNAAEWIDSCDSEDGASDTCHLLGGSHIDNRSYCTEAFDSSRDTTASPFGFRCCSGQAGAGR